MQITEKALQDRLNHLAMRRSELSAQLNNVDGAIMQCSEFLKVLRTPDISQVSEAGADTECAICGRRGNPPDCGGKCPIDARA